jgi:AAA15 family ATPase/GTPase
MPFGQSFLAGLFTSPPRNPPAYRLPRDESFNSITGLNGSGKSNILDSICFVLGINNLSVVRAQNLQVSDESDRSTDKRS